MIPKFTLFVALILMSFCGFAQTENIDSIMASYDTVPPVLDTVVNKVDTVRVFYAKVKPVDTSIRKTQGREKFDSIFAHFDAVSTLPDSLRNNIDTSRRTLVLQTKLADTSVRKKDTLSVAEETVPPVIKFDRRWFISPLLKFQAQEFGMLEKQRMQFQSDAHLLNFLDRSNISVAASVYKNFSKNISMSVDIGLSMGHISSEDSLISNTKRKTSNIVNATLYYHLLGGQYKLQPFIAAGINNVMNDASYTSAPVGAGVKYTGKRIMIEAQGAYGYAISKNIANTLTYSVGIYIPLRRKDSKKDAEKGKKDTINIINITNNYYLLSKTDSIRNAREDSMRRETARLLEIKKVEDSAAFARLDPDDPMRLPGARKFIVYFNYDQYSLTSSAFNSIDLVIDMMKRDKHLNVHLKGHTDMAGSEVYNAPLSKKRAQMVYDYMNSMGIGSERILLSGYGKLSPAVKDEDPNTAWRNRRCELVLFEKTESKK